MGKMYDTSQYEKSTTAWLRGCFNVLLVLAVPLVWLLENFRLIPSLLGTTPAWLAWLYLVGGGLVGGVVSTAVADRFYTKHTGKSYQEDRVHYRLLYGYEIQFWLPTLVYIGAIGVFAWYYGIPVMFANFWQVIITTILVSAVLSILIVPFVFKKVLYGKWQEAPENPLTKEPGPIFKEAVTRLHDWDESSAPAVQRRKELAEILSLSQQAVAENPRDVYGYLLLADVLRLAAELAGSADDQAYEYFMTRAAAVIQHWAGLKNDRKSKELGSKLLEMIRNAIARQQRLGPTEAEQRMNEYRSMFLAEALDPASLPRMQHFLDF